MPEPHKHCHYCGKAYEVQKWPRTCGACGEITWQNPIPVVVCLVRVGRGILLIRRNIEPDKGEWVLPGGYIDLGETWQEAAHREVLEETSGLVHIHKDYFRLLGVENAKTTSHLLIFAGCHRTIESLDERDITHGFQPNHEVSELKLVYEPVQLIWFTHTEYLRRVFEGF